MKAQDLIEQLVYDGNDIKAFSDPEQTDLLNCLRQGEVAKKRLLGSLAKEFVKSECELKIGDLQNEIEIFKSKIKCKHELQIDSDNWFFCELCYVRIEVSRIADLIKNQ